MLCEGAFVKFAGGLHGAKFMGDGPAFCEGERWVRGFDVLVMRGVGVRENVAIVAGTKLLCEREHRLVGREDVVPDTLEAIKVDGEADFAFQAGV